MTTSLKQYESLITPLLSEEEIDRRTRELAAQITTDYAGMELVCVGVLKGVFPFFADLVRRIDLPLRCDFLALSSYGASTKSSGVVRLTHDLSRPVNDRHVLVVEDIVDTGLTMNYLLEILRMREARSVKICTLLHKPENERVAVPLDYTGFVIPNHFVVGYGLDYDERFRNLPYIGYFAGEIPTLPDV